MDETQSRLFDAVKVRNGSQFDSNLGGMVFCWIECTVTKESKRNIHTTCVHVNVSKKKKKKLEERFYRVGQRLWSALQLLKSHDDDGTYTHSIIIQTYVKAAKATGI